MRNYDHIWLKERHPNYSIIFQVSASHSVLVVGSSLHVFSGYRIILQAKEEGKRVAILNIGATRADQLADLKISARAGEVFNRIKL